MRYVGLYNENQDIATKEKVDAKQDKITVAGFLKSDGDGTITASETIEASAVTVPDGILKGSDGTITAAVAGTDYLTAADKNEIAEAAAELVDVAPASSTTPKSPGVANAGSENAYARGDHVHPKQSVSKSDVGLGNVDNVSINARLNRTTNVNAADTNYTTYMARGESLNASEVTPTVNGCIAWVYG